MKNPDVVTANIRIVSNLSDGSGIVFQCGFDPDTDSRNMTFRWILGGEDGPGDLDDKKEGDEVYLNQFDDIDGMKAFLSACLSALLAMETQMRSLPS